MATKPSVRPDYRQWKCKHFTGVLKETCAAGYRYRDTHPQGGIIPCIDGVTRTSSDQSPNWGQCPGFELYSDAEYRALEDAHVARVTGALAKLAGDICPHCDAKVEGHQQVGRCVYAQPCGHRLYQGKATLPLLNQRATPPEHEPEQGSLF